LKQKTPRESLTVRGVWGAKKSLFKTYSQPCIAGTVLVAAAAARDAGLIFMALQDR
jgi:hypothetical protein